MPIVRWHGWAAKCGACKKLVMLGDETVAYSKREEVVEAVRPSEDKCWRTIETAIWDLCGCKKEARKR